MATQATHRVWKFSPGPAVLPVPVLERARDELLSLPGCGASILEISHRSPTFIRILESAQHRLRALLGAGPEFEIIFLQGGSRLQFSMIPMNLMRAAAAPAEYIVTGSWSSKAVDEAQREGPVRVIWDGKATNYDRLPTPDELTFDGRAPYRYYASNETIQGVQFPADPQQAGLAGETPLVCDASSDFLCRPTPIAPFGLLYACAQKNAGPAGVTAVVLRKELLDRSSDRLPGYINYASHVADQSLYNTPPTFAIYMLDLVLQWLQETVGGLTRMAAINRRKADLIYSEIDRSAGFYRGHAQRDCRSLMNVTFRLPSADLEKQFLESATQHELTNLAGHRSVGGVRASLYNAMPEEGVAALAHFMRDFAVQFG